MRWEKQRTSPEGRTDGRQEWDDANTAPTPILARPILGPGWVGASAPQACSGGRTPILARKNKTQRQQTIQGPRHRPGSGIAAGARRASPGRKGPPGREDAHVKPCGPDDDADDGGGGNDGVDIVVDVDDKTENGISSGVA